VAVWLCGCVAVWLDAAARASARKEARQGRGNRAASFHVGDDRRGKHRTHDTNLHNLDLYRSFPHALNFPFRGYNLTRNDPIRPQLGQAESQKLRYRRRRPRGWLHRYPVCLGQGDGDAAADERRADCEGQVRLFQPTNPACPLR
jgi:hypothetical protein